MAGPFSYLKFQTKCFLFREASLAFFLSDLHPIIFLKKKKKAVKRYTQVAKFIRSYILSSADIYE